MNCSRLSPRARTPRKGPSRARSCLYPGSSDPFRRTIRARITRAGITAATVQARSGGFAGCGPVVGRFLRPWDLCRGGGGRGAEPFESREHALEMESICVCPKD